jgi:20S proteasome alpha/beta subunit
MTTIAYHHATKTIAYDSRITSGSLIESDAFDKAIDYMGNMFVMAGSCTDYMTFIKAYESSEDYNGNHAEAFMFNANSDLVKHLYVYDDTKIGAFNLTYDFAIGSGRLHAITAMDCGKTAKEAVKFAIKRDSCSGGKIHVVKLNDYLA